MDTSNTIPSRARRVRVLLVGLLLVVAACSGTTSETTASGAGATETTAATEGATSAPTDAPDDGGTDVEPTESAPITIGVPGIPPVFVTMSAYVAQEQGFFEEYGADVTIRPFETGADSLRAVISGEVDVAMPPTALTVQLGATEAPDLRAVLGYDVVDWLVASTNPDVQACEDLAGQTIGVDSVGGARYIVADQIMSSCGLDLEGGDAQTANFPGAAMAQAVAAGQLETAVFHIDELAITQEQYDGEIVVVERMLNANPNAHYLLVATRQETIDANRSGLAAMVAGLLDAAAFINDPANTDVVAEISTETGQTVEQARASLEQFQEIGFWPVDRLGIDDEQLGAVVQTAVDNGDIASADALDIDAFIAQEVFEDATALRGQ